MSAVRVRASEESERRVLAIREALVREAELPLPDKWVVLRLALAVSLRMGTPEGVEPEGLRPKDRGGPEYRLQQITGEGRGRARLERAEDTERLDITDALRAALSALHRVDLFHPETGARDLGAVVEFHLTRGLEEIARTMEASGGDLWAALSGLLASAPEARDMDREAPSPRGLADALWDLGLHVDVLRPPHHGPRLSRYALRLADPRDLGELRARLDQLALGLGAPIGSLSLEQGEEPRVMLLDVPRAREQWARVGLAELEAARGKAPAGAALPVCPGVDVVGEPRWYDLGAAPHLLVAGTTGSGKSVALHALLVSLLMCRGPGEVALTLIDLKGTELGPWTEVPHAAGPLVRDPSAARAALEQAVAEMEERYARLVELGARDLADGRRRGLSLPARVLVVDELADLLLALPESEAPLVRLAQKGRAAGLHLVLATQRPDARTLSGLLRSNVPSRVALAVQRASESRIILDEPGAEGLLRPGDMLIRWGGAPARRHHGFDLRPDDVERAVRALVRNA